MDRNAPFAAFGRILIAALFIISGVGKFAEPGATQAGIAAAGLPLPLLAMAVSIAVEIGGGILLIMGYRTQIVALVLALFAVTTAFVFHRVHGDANQQMNFLKNLAIAGGLLQLAAFGAGRLSLDANRSDARKRGAQIQEIRRARSLRGKSSPQPIASAAVRESVAMACVTRKYSLAPTTQSLARGRIARDYISS